MTVTELKQYIYDNQLIEFILNEIGCGHIVYHSNKEYYSCCNIDGDNPSAIIIRNNPYLNCNNYTRKMDFDNKSDLLTLVQYNKKKNTPQFSFWDTIKYLHKILKLPLSIKQQRKSQNNEIDDPLYIFKQIKTKKLKQNVLELNVLSEDELQDFIPHVHIDFFREGIVKKTIERFGLAYSYKYKRTIIPLRFWLTGELLGFNMRTSVTNFDLLGIKKYLITPGYPKSQNIFGLWENKDYIKNVGYVVVYESEKSVLRRDSLKDSSGVAVSGHDISDEQARILIGLNCEIIIAFDKDINREHIRYCCNKFYGIRKISYMYDSYDLLKKKDSPADASDKIWKFLFKYRIEYDSEEHQYYLKTLKSR